MPSKGIYKIYQEDSFYHIYNRGNNKQDIFVDEKDYEKFITVMWLLINEINDKYKGHNPQLTIHAYCLMPNHFHLLIKQTEKNAITMFMKRFMVRYTMYFNKKHQRLGSLFQSRFKANLVDTEEYLLYLTKYIHQNPRKFWSKNLSDYPYSSYPVYLNLRSDPFLITNEILDFFQSSKKLSLKKHESSRSFVEEIEIEGTTLEYLGSGYDL